MAESTRLENGRAPARPNPLGGSRPGRCAPAPVGGRGTGAATDGGDRTGDAQVPFEKLAEPPDVVRSQTASDAPHAARRFDSELRSGFDRSAREEAGFKQLAVPLCSAIILDFLDLAPFDRLAPPLSAIIGAVAGLVLARVTGLHQRYYVWIALIAGLYSGIPRTGMVPLATLFAAATLFRKLGDDGKR